jgi:ethanolamine ammonia-lyase small subunit
MSDDGLVVDGTPVDPGSASDPWQALRDATRARVALGRTGDSLGIAETLALRLAHAAARDAVHVPVDMAALQAAVGERRHVVVHSAAPDRHTYLQRPDLGRRLDDAGRAALEGPASDGTASDGTASDGTVSGFDLVVVIADGLSSRAVQEHAVPLLDALTARLDDGCRVGPVVLAEQARVALGDEIGALLGAELVLVLIGERPGLSAADSLGAYLTYRPRIGCPDSARNCLSNIRPPDGQDYPGAARTLALLMAEARKRQLTGVELKDDFDALTA